MANESKYSIIITAVDASQAAFDSIRNGLGKITGVAGIVTGALGTLGISISALGFAGMVKNTLDSADAMGKAAQKAGITTEALSGLKYAASLADVEFDSLQTGIKKLNVNMTDAARGNASAQESFTALGIKVKDSSGKLRGSEQVLLDIADAFQKMPDGAQKADLAVKLFGKSGTEMIPFLNAGKDGIKQLTAEAERMGLVISSKAAADAEKFNDNLKRLESGVEGVKNKIGIGLLPVLNGLVDKFMEAGGGLDEFGNKTKGALDNANIMKWAEGALTGLAWVVDSAHGLVVVVEGIGKTLGAGVAQAAAIISGDFKGAAEIGRQWSADMAASIDYTPLANKTHAFFDELTRTVSINGKNILYENASVAEAIRAELDANTEYQKERLAGVTVKTSEELKKQNELSKFYAEELKKTTMGVHDYAVSKIRERYQIELDATKGMANEYTLAAEINKRMDDEIASLSYDLQTKRIDGEKALAGVYSSSADQRIGVERNAANEIIGYQKGIYDAKNAASGPILGDPSLTVGQASDKFWQKFNKGSVFDLATAPRYATGGSFMVGGNGGTDTTPVRFMATPGERVTVQTPAQQAGAGGSIVIQNVNLHGITDARQFVEQLKQMLRTDPNLLTVGARAG